MRLTTKQLCIEAMAVIALVAMVLLSSAITGYTTGRTAEFSDSLNLTFNESVQHAWTPQNVGELRSIGISGRATLQSDGYVRVSITDGNTTRTIYQTEYKPELNVQPLTLPEPSIDITGALSSVGLAVDEFGEMLDEMPVDVTPVNETPVVETPAEIPASNETSAGESDNATNATVESPPAPIEPAVNETNETAYVEPVNETPVIETPQEENTTAQTETPAENITTASETSPELQSEQSETFARTCVETCKLKDFANAENNYTLIIEVSNATLQIDEISYEIKQIPKPEKLGIAIEQGEQLSDDTGEKVGKKVADDPAFETYFTFVGVVGDVFTLNFYHDAEIAQPVWIENMYENYTLNYTLSSDRAEQFEDVSLNVTLQDGKIPRFRLHVGRDSDVFEFGITVITVQSYPAVGDNWTVAFNTTGTADLIITGYNGTAFGTDLEFLELACDNTTLNATFNGTSVIYPDYACDEIGTETSRVITAGRHTLEFSFGDSVDYAHNIAGANLSCIVRTSCESNETDVLHMSDTTDAHAELPDGTDYSYKVCCKDTSGYNAISTDSSGYDFLHLHSATDSHSEQRSLSNYANAAYIKANASNMTCSYDNVSGSCSSGKACLLTMSDSTDAHVADCTSDPYEITVCCSLESVGEPANYTTFNGSTTDFNGVPDINNVSQPVLENTDYGKIAWSGSVNASGADFDSAITISTNLVRVNSSILNESFNSSATITLYGVSFTNPKPTWDPEDDGTFVNCPADVCTEISYEGGNFAFSVTGFTGYSSSETNPPSKVTLYAPESGSSTVDLTPTFEWNNATSDDGPLTYDLQVDDDSNFGSPAIGETNIEEGSPRTSYTPVDELAVDATYFWHVRAYDGSQYGDWSDTWNFTVESSIELTLPTDTVNFGTVDVSSTYNTTTDSPSPFVLRNDGNVAVNVTIYATNYWQRVANPSSNYQFKCGDTPELSCPFGSQTSWTNMPDSAATLAVNMPHYNSTDELQCEIKITVPSDEPAGAHDSTVYIIASQA